MMRAINNQTYVPPAASMSAALASGYSSASGGNGGGTLRLVIEGNDELGALVENHARLVVDDGFRDLKVEIRRARSSA